MKKILPLYLTFVLIIMLIASLLPSISAIAAVDMQAGKPAFVLGGHSDGRDSANRNSTEIAFNGHIWDIVGYDGVGNVNQSSIITLFSTNFEPYSPRSVRFCEDGYNNIYAESDLRSTLDSSVPSGKERGLIVPTNLNDVGVHGAMLWPLSSDEYWLVNRTVSNFQVGDYWLRDIAPPHPSYGYMYPDRNWVYNVSTAFNSADPTWNLSEALNIRPAFRMDTSNVMFTSFAEGVSGQSKSSVMPSDGLIDTVIPKVHTTSAQSALKFTVKHSSQTLAVLATEEQSTQSDSTLSFSYRNATTGSNQFVSCILEQSGEFSYYGKIANSSSASSGNLSIPLSGVADGTYTLKIFSEEANGDRYTDFCSEPVTMTLTVSGGIGTVSDFSGTIVYPNTDPDPDPDPNPDHDSNSSSTSKPTSTPTPTTTPSADPNAFDDVPKTGDATGSMRADGRSPYMVWIALGTVVLVGNACVLLIIIWRKRKTDG